MKDILRTVSTKCALLEEHRQRAKEGGASEVQQNQEERQAPNPQADGVVGKEGLFLQNCAQTHGYGACQTSLSFLSFLRDYRIRRNWQGM